MRFFVIFGKGVFLVDVLGLLFKVMSEVIAE